MSDFAKALPKFSKLRILNLERNNLQNEGTELLASALKATWILCYWRSHPQPSECITPGIVWRELVHDRRVLGWTGAFASTVRVQVVLFSSRLRVAPLLWLLITGSTWMCVVRRAPFLERFQSDLSATRRESLPTPLESPERVEELFHMLPR